MEMVIQNRRQDAGLSSGASVASFPSQLTMTSFIHALNIGTLATWLSVAGFGAVGVMAPHWRSETKVAPVVQVQADEESFTLGEASLAETAVESSPSEAMDTPSPQSPLTA
jgi:D-arabinose 1-dehydrogenase-like Zn-dependent alcohol dehydrogenase